VKKLAAAGFVAVIFCLALFALASWRKRMTADEPRQDDGTVALGTRLPSLDARGFSGVKEISKRELVTLLTATRPLSRYEIANLDRGCPGFVCIYQGLGLTRWPESAPGTRAYLRREDALARGCPDGRENFVFLKQAWWEGGKAPKPDAITGQVPLASITRAKPGWYTFNYAIYFPETNTYAWIDHREYGFPLNLFKPLKAYLSVSPPPLDENRPAQIYCSTCRRRSPI
jgi:hypothetical protein